LAIFRYCALKGRADAGTRIILSSFAFCSSRTRGILRPQYAGLPAIPAPKPVAAPAPEAEQPTPKKGFYAATRAGKKKATASLSTEAHRQLKLLAVDHGGVEALLTEAINDLFRKYGKEPIA
jgi:hypothetical protein